MQLLFSKQELSLTLKRLALLIYEDYASDQLQNLALIAIQPRGVALGKVIHNYIQEQTKQPIHYGVLDITFYRDDVREEKKLPYKTDINFDINNKNIVLIDDVLYTGRTIRAALDALQDFGRPANIKLSVLVDRSFNRELPVQANYVGKTVDSKPSQKVEVNVATEEVKLT